jgi:hypothetical protein
MLTKYICTALFCAMPLFLSAQKVADFNLKFLEPGRDSWSSMPLGNGETSCQAWTDGEGKVQFYIGANGARDAMDDVLKVGKLTVEFEPNIFRNAAGYSEELLVNEGLFRIKSNTASLQIRVDANHPQIVVWGNSRIPVKVKVTSNIWRRETRNLEKEEYINEYGNKAIPFVPYVEADETVKGLDDAVIWYHRNKSEVFWNEMMKANGLLHEGIENPLKNRTFGAIVKGKGMRVLNDTTLQSVAAAKTISFKTTLLTRQTATAEQYVNEIKELAASLEGLRDDAMLAAHKKWWAGYWGRSYVFFNAADKALNDTLTQLNRGYILQRYVSALAGRGALPIKFNGSTLVLDTYHQKIGRVSGRSADARLWGGAFWWQNTRLPYYPMLASGDFDLIQPFLDFYLQYLEVAKKKTRKFYGINGARFAETVHFWGAWRGSDIGWDRSGLKPGRSNNPYIKDLIIGGLEMSNYLIDYCSYTGNAQLLEEKAMPFVREILSFYDQYYPRDENGKLHMAAAQSLETYIEGVNPTPDIAGLQYVIPRVMAITRDTALLALCGRLQKATPALPMAEKNGKKLILPIESYKQIINVEYPELYAVFPFRLYGVGKKDIETAVHTFNDKQRTYWGWHQTGIQAAMLGLTDSAVKVMQHNGMAFDKRFRFPAFWGPNYDYTPDQDHASNFVHTIQAMLLQADDDHIYLLPAWPAHWNVAFKLHAPGKTQVEAVWKNGRFTRVQTWPASRKKDIQTVHPK